MKAEACHVAVRGADAAAEIFGTGGTGGILNHQQVVPCRESTNLIYGRGQPNLVHQKNRSCFGGNELFQTARVHVVCFRLDVGEDGCRTYMDNRIRRGDVRQTGTDHLVLGTDSRDQQCQMQRGRAGRNGDRILRSHILRKPLFEFGYLPALA